MSFTRIVVSSWPSFSIEVAVEDLWSGAIAMRLSHIRNDGEDHKAEMRALGLACRRLLSLLKTAQSLFLLTHTGEEGGEPFQ